MLSIDGVHIENDLGLHLLADSDETALPQVRQDTVTIPGKHGAYDFDTYMESRQFFERILIPTQATLNDVQSIARNVSTLLLDQYGKAKTVKLVFDYEPDKYYMAKFSGFISIDRIAKAGIFPIPFKAYDPYAYAESTAYDEPPVSYDTGEQYGSGLMYPNTELIEWTNTRQYSGVHNYSYYVTPFSFMIEGAVINPRITNQTTGKATTFNVSLASDERLYIDSQRYQAWKVKVTEDEHYWLAPDFLMADKTEWQRMNLYGEVVGKFPELVSGDNGFLFEGGLPDATIHYNWKHKFM